MMSLEEYARSRYLPDLVTFRAHYPETIPYLAGDEITRRCVEVQIDPVCFISNTYLESLLLAAVCDHDRDHFHRYRDVTECERRLGAIGGLQGLRLPQKMFSNLHWTPHELEVLASGIGALVPQWARAYGNLIGAEGDGVHIVAALLHDDDVDECPQRVRSDFIAAIRRGLRTAANEIGINEIL